MRDTGSAREAFAFAHPLRVRWSEVDRQDVVFNPHYFTYFDVAVGEYWRAIGFAYPASTIALGTDIFAVDARAQFLGSATYDDDLEIAVRVTRLGRSSFDVELGIFRGPEKLTRGTLTYVHTRVPEKKSEPLPETFRELVRRFERVAPDER